MYNEANLTNEQETHFYEGLNPIDKEQQSLESMEYNNNNYLYMSDNKVFAGSATRNAPIDNNYVHMKTNFTD